MIHELMAMLTKTVNMTEEQKKEKLVELKVKQLIREKLNVNDSTSITPAEEIEAMAILQTLTDLDDPANTIEKIISLRDEITKRAEEKIAALKQD